MYTYRFLDTKVSAKRCVKTAATFMALFTILSAQSALAQVVKSGSASQAPGKKTTGQVMSPAATVKKNPKAVTLQGGIDQVEYALKSSGVTLDEAKLPSLVNNVRLGSPAYYGGLAEGDKVLKASIAEDKLNLLFERKGKRFFLSLHTSPADFAKFVKGVPVKDKTSEVDLVAGVPTSDEQKMKALARHDLVILIDTSGSMNETIPSLKMTKRQWCERFLSSFSDRTKEALAGRGLTIIPFNSGYHIMRGCTSDQVKNLFATTRPDGGTDFASPLQEVLATYLGSGRQRPLMIAVFTDGIPSHGPRIEHVLVNATKEMHSGREVQLTFLAVGEDHNGANLLKYLDDYLVHDGAIYDVVQTVGFEQLKHMSLFDVFMLALEHKASTQNGIGSEIDRLKQQIEDQRLEAEKNGKLKAR